jgi:hypothetical protein
MRNLRTSHRTGARYRGLDLGVESRVGLLPSAIALMICTRNGDIPAAAIVAVAIINRDSVARCEFSFAKVARSRSLNQVLRRNAKMVRASVEQHFICQFSAR